MHFHIKTWSYSSKGHRLVWASFKTDSFDDGRDALKNRETSWIWFGPQRFEVQQLHDKKRRYLSHWLWIMLRTSKKENKWFYIWEFRVSWDKRTRFLQANLYRWSLISWVGIHWLNDNQSTLGKSFEKTVKKRLCCWFPSDRLNEDLIYGKFR